MRIQVEPANAVIGAIIHDLDLSKQLDEETASQVRDLFYQYSVLCFRGQNLAEADFVRFSHIFGDLETHFLSEYQRPGHPEIYVVSNIVENGKAIGISDAGTEWHTDSSWAKAPSAASILYAVEVPVRQGVVLGNTLFSSMTAAYDTLDPDLRGKLKELRASHGYEHRHAQRMKAAGSTRKELTEEQKKRATGATHPVIRTHPVTAKSCVYVNKWFTTGLVGVPEQEAEPLLQSVYSHVTKDDFIYRHKWQKGDVIIWDNCAVQHKAIQDYALPERRLMWRTTVQGSIPS